MDPQLVELVYRLGVIYKRDMTANIKKEENVGKLRI